MGLRPELLRAVKEQGYTVPTPVQSESIPLILNGRDIMAGAQTGTGKTAGFTLPMLQKLAEKNSHPGSKGNNRRGPRALVLAPTRELAAQVAESVRVYGQFMPLRSTVIFGGVGFNPQVQKIRRGVDIVIATPGRLLDHCRQGTIDLSGVEILVLDEADRMLDMGFLPDIKQIISQLHSNRQNLLFSATFPKEIKTLASSLLNDPAEVQVAPNGTTAELVEQLVHPVDRKRKRELLSRMIKSDGWSQVLVFCRTKHGANKLCDQLRTDGIKATAIHGNKSQAARTSALNDFKRNRYQVLVATDIAARGLDIDQLPHVVNFDLPYVPEDYVHRIGRTGRAGSTGQAVSLVAMDEVNLLNGIERLLKMAVPSSQVEGFEVPGWGERKARAATRGGSPKRPWEKNRSNGNGGGNGQRAHRGGGGQRSGNGERSRNDDHGNRSGGSRSGGSGHWSEGENRFEGNRSDGNRSNGNRSNGNRSEGNRDGANRSNGNGPRSQRSGNGNGNRYGGPAGNGGNGNGARRTNGSGGRPKGNSNGRPSGGPSGNRAGNGGARKSSGRGKIHVGN